ncbi:MAG: hypothetical protein Q8P41_19270 [Pseudomonadota bacterium]|nr:hypothetical protein [Pseudomonadota bacterium]
MRAPLFAAPLLAAPLLAAPLLAAPLLCAALLAGCTGGAPAEDSASTCAEEPVVTWDNFGDALLTGHCQSCHASTSPDRAGAPVGVIFDTHADATAQKDAILRVATGEAPTMPPGLSIGDTDRELLRVWLTCYE